MIFRSPYPDVAIPDLAYSDFVFEGLAQRADRPAFIDGPSGRTLTHGEVHAGARCVASALARRGLRKGDRFAIASPNLPEYAVAFHGVAMAGGVMTTANPLAAIDELAWQLNDSGARFLLTVPAFIDNARAAAARSRVEELFVFGEAPGATPFSALLHEGDEPPALAIDPRTDLLVLPYSSGTTGRCKGAMLAHRNAVAMLAQFEPLQADASGHRALAVRPFFHAYSMTVMMRRCVAARAASRCRASSSSSTCS